MPPSNFSGRDSVSFPPAFWQAVNTNLFLPDTVPGSTDDQPVSATISFFPPHKQSQEYIDRPRVTSESDWWYGSFAIILIIIVFLKVVYSRQINQLLKAFFIPGTLSAGERFFPFRFDLFAILFSLIYSISFALLTVSVVRDFHLMPTFTQATAMNLFFFSALVFLVLLVVKTALVQLGSSFFSLKFSGPYYRDIMLASAFITAAFVIPLIVANVFSASLVPLIMTLTIVVLFPGFRLYRTLSVSFGNNGFSVYHFILYFCTLEALPVILIGKILFVFLMPS